MPCGGLGGIGECAGLDIECAAAGEVPRFFYVCGKKNGGESGIRTRGEVAPTTIFETVAFDRSAISPSETLA